MSKVLPFLPLFDSTPPVEAPPPPAAPPSGPPDAAARAEALDIRRSFIVEAPAGSGKTGLLIQRFLKLLADEAVTAPEQVLAITFTIAATAEMRDRVLAHLEGAHRDSSAATARLRPPDPRPGPRRPRARPPARLVAARSSATPQHPHHRLRLRRDRAHAARPLRQRRPPYSRQRRGPLHREAARRTLLLLGNEDADFNAALRNLLLHRDGNLADCEALIANMLSLRDQWGNLIPLDRRELDDEYLDTNVLPRLELRPRSCHLLPARPPRTDLPVRRARRSHHPRRRTRRMSTATAANHLPLPSAAAATSLQKPSPLTSSTGMR